MSGDRSPPVPPVVADRWEELLDDARATAAAYREAGWETLLIHTGEVTPLDGEERFGLDAVAPDNEYADLRTLAADVTFDTTHVFHATESGVRFLLVTVEASDAETAVLVPAYLPLDEAPSLQRRADEAGVMYTHVRPISEETRVTVSHDDPSLFFQ